MKHPMRLVDKSETPEICAGLGLHRQMIGVSRETVSRLLGELRNGGIIQLKGSSLFIKDKAALERMVNS